MRVLHVLDHSLPLHSGYAFRTRAIMRAQLADGLYGVGVSFSEVIRKEEASPALPVDQHKAADIQRISQAILH